MLGVILSPKKHHVHLILEDFKVMVVYHGVAGGPAVAFPVVFQAKHIPKLSRYPGETLSRELKLLHRALEKNQVVVCHGFINQNSVQH